MLICGIRNRIWGLGVVFIVFLSICPFNNDLKAQIFKLDSVIIEKVRHDSLGFNLPKNTNSNRLPILVDDKTFIMLFGLKDTIIDGIHMNYFTSHEDIIKKYGLKRDKSNYIYLLIFLYNVTDKVIQIGYIVNDFSCDKHFFNKKHHKSIARNGIEVFEYNMIDKSITTKIIVFAL